MFKPFYGKCSAPNCTHGDKVLIPVKSGLCVRCNHEKKQAAKGDKAKKPYLSPVSDKREKEQRLYSVARKLFLKHHPVCKMKIEGLCTIAATEIQHLRGRVGDLYLDQRFWMSVCHQCHKYATEHPAEAIEKGWAMLRLTGE